MPPSKVLCNFWENEMTNKPFPQLLYSQEDRMRLIKVRESYLDIFRTRPELRVEEPELWHKIVDQFDEVTALLEEDETEITRLTCTRKLDDDEQLLIKKLNGTEHPLGEWEICND